MQAVTKSKDPSLYVPRSHLHMREKVDFLWEVSPVFTSQLRNVLSYITGEGEIYMTREILTVD